MRKVGRPKLKKSAFKGRLLAARMSPDEFRRCQAQAKAAGVTVSAWLRGIVVEALDRPLPVAKGIVEAPAVVVAQPLSGAEGGK